MIKGYSLHIRYRGCSGRFNSLDFRTISVTNYRAVYALCKCFEPVSLKVEEKDLSEWLTHKDRVVRTAWWNVALHLCEPHSKGGISTIKRRKYILDGIKRCIREVAFKKEDDEIYGRLSGEKLRRNTRHSR